jgi:hypothetical protein
MTRINVYDYPEYEPAVFAGWFDDDKAEVVNESQQWDGNNMVPLVTGSYAEHEALYRTAAGRWVLHHWSQWQGSHPTYRFLTDDEARNWLLRDEDYGLVEKWFGEMDDESGPNPVGKPEIGGRATVLFGTDLLARVDDYAASRGEKRAEAIRDLLARALDTVTERTAS